MVCLVINGKKLPHADIFVERLKEVPGMTSISYNINQEKTNVILGSELVNLYGPGYITDKIGNVSYQISPAFFLSGQSGADGKNSMERRWNTRG